MKIYNLADLHLGRKKFRKASQFINDIERLGYEQFKKAINVIKDSWDDDSILIIEGDIFHSSTPNSRVIIKALEIFDYIDNLSIKTRIIAGNHEYNELSKQINQHVFDAFQNRYKNIKFISEGYEIEEFDDTVICYIPHYQLYKNPESGKIDKSDFNEFLVQITDEISKYKDKKKVLASHGVVKMWVERFMNEEDSLALELLELGTTVFPDWFPMKTFDYTVLGHIHNGFVQKLSNESNESRVLISPGTLMEDNEGSFKIDNDSSEYGPVIIDTETGDITTINIPTIQNIRITINNKEELEEFLKNIEYNIYFVKYLGDWKDIESDLYKEAINKALHFSMKVEDISTQNRALKGSIKEFWAWAKENVSEEQYLEMQNMVKEE